jgi:hypothetical protein
MFIHNKILFKKKKYHELAKFFDELSHASTAGNSELQIVTMWPGLYYMGHLCYHGSVAVLRGHEFVLRVTLTWDLAYLQVTFLPVYAIRYQIHNCSCKKKNTKEQTYWDISLGYVGGCCHRISVGFSDLESCRTRKGPSPRSYMLPHHCECLGDQTVRSRERTLETEGSLRQHLFFDDLTQIYGLCRWIW